MEEKRALARLKRGDIGGLEVLVRQYQVEAVRTAYLIVRDRGLAEDVVQEAFVRVYERIAQFDPSRPFRPWFLRIVANDALKAARRRARTVPLESDDPDRAGWLDSLPDDAPLPAALVEQAETSEQLWALLAELSPEQRRVLVLRYYVGLKNAEIAAELDLPPGTVRWRLHAARQQLRHRLGNLGRRSAEVGTETESKEVLR